MIFSNPWGFLALLGIPAVLVIHSLRRSPMKFLSNTLFLIETRLRDPGGGRRLRRLRRSAQLWLRLLLVALLAWILAKPVKVREDSTQRVILVIDAGASMSAFRSGLVAALRAAVEPWGNQSGHTEWIALSSLPDAPPIYRGWDDLDRLLGAVSDLELRAPTHDPAQALNLARGLALDHGRVLFASDHIPSKLPPGIGLLAIGSEIPNVGWCGLEVSPDGSWQAILRNYAPIPQRRELRVGGGVGAEVELAAGEWRTLDGRIPDGEERIKLSLSQDDFPTDDELYLIRPRAKRLTWAGQSPPQALERLFRAGGLGRAAADVADIEVRPNDQAPAEAERSRLLIPTLPAETAAYVRVPASSAAHPLTDGLIFDGLLWRRCAPLNPPQPGEVVLLWSGPEPLAILRANTLELGFHPDLSNFDRVPSALVLIQRWLDSVRAAKVAPESLQLSSGERVEIAIDPTGPAVEHVGVGILGRPSAASSIELRVPDLPGAMTIRQGEAALLEAAVNFVDPLESDFSKCAASFIPPPEPAATTHRAMRPDRFRELWLLLVIAVLLLTWRFPETNARPQPA